MEFSYLWNDAIVVLYVKGFNVYAERISVNKPGAYLLGTFPSVRDAEDYVAGVKREKLTELHEEALKEDAARQRPPTITEYVIEAVDDNGQHGHDVATYFDDELTLAQTRLEMLRESGRRVRLVKWVTTSEVID